RLGYPTPPRPDLQTPTEFIKALRVTVEQDEKRREVEQRARDGEARATAAEEAAEFPTMGGLEELTTCGSSPQRALVHRYVAHPNRRRPIRELGLVPEVCLLLKEIVGNPALICAGD